MAKVSQIRRKASRVDTQKIEVFILRQFEERSEKISDFVQAADYTEQAVRLTLSGDIGSPRIRQDIARYLGYKNWYDLVQDYLRSKRDDK